MFKKKNNRACPRTNGYFLAKYKLLSHQQDNTIPVLTSAKDIGCGGVRLRLKENIPVGINLRLYVNLPGYDKTIEVLAKIVWIKKLRGDDKYEAGIQFVDIDENIRKAIADRVNDILR